VLSETWENGPITGTLTRNYNNDFRVIAVSINGNSINYQYDNDGLLTQVGDLSLHREAQNGFLIGTTLSQVITQRTLNSFGELDSETVTYQGNTLYQVAYQRDKLGRITEKVETIEGQTTTYDYHYNLAGQLVEVFQNKVSINRYGYDDNGNRITLNGVVIGSHDNQDRLIQYGENQYTYTKNGELQTKIHTATAQTTSYTYDVFTNLTHVQLPDGTEIEYLIDGRDRRIGKRVNGQLVQGFLYQGSLNPIAELDANGNIVTQFVYGGRGNVPAYLIKNQQTFRVIADSLGSPRLVINVTTGEITQRIDYDEFGNVQLDTNPGFQPFGFAGGIYDLDTGLIRFGARDYDPKAGRWTAKDPILFAGGDANLYGYVLSNPINWIDEDGLEAALSAPVTNGGIGETVSAIGKAVVSTSRAVVVGSGAVVTGIGMALYPTPVGVGSDIIPIEPTQMARPKNSGRNWATEEAKSRAQKNGTTACEELDKMMDEAKCQGNTKKQKDIKQAQKYLGCRHHHDLQ
jgi:RHS repeat-associated protein